MTLLTRSVAFLCASYASLALAPAQAQTDLQTFPLVFKEMKVTSVKTNAKQGQPDSWELQAETSVVRFACGFAPGAGLKSPTDGQWLECRITLARKSNDEITPVSQFAIVDFYHHGAEVLFKDLTVGDRVTDLTFDPTEGSSIQLKLTYKGDQRAYVPNGSSESEPYRFIRVP